MAPNTTESARGTLERMPVPAGRSPGRLLSIVIVMVTCWALMGTAAHAAGRGNSSSPACAGPVRQLAARQARPSAPAAVVYPEFKWTDGRVVRWIKEQMPLKVYVSHGLAIDGIIDEELGAPIANTSNRAAWPDLVAKILSTPGQFESLPVANGYSDDMYAAVVAGINMWKPFERESLFTYQLTTEPDADIFVFWVHHFVDKSGMGLFAGDIRGYTSKTNFPFRAIMAGGKADFKPVVIMLRTTEASGAPMSLQKLRASAGHEFGHALGIEQHSRNPVDLMSLYYGNGTISPSDAATIRYLYHLTPDLIP